MGWFVLLHSFEKDFLGGESLRRAVWNIGELGEAVLLSLRCVLRRRGGDGGRSRLLTLLVVGVKAKLDVRGQAATENKATATNENTFQRRLFELSTCVDCNGNCRS